MRAINVSGDLNCHNQHWSCHFLVRDVY